jgi:quercetin dioxygenase-like cupin family protein
VAAPHVHHEHTDAFYVDGELTFEIGREAKTITVSSGGFVTAPPGMAHPLRNDSDGPRAGVRSTHATGDSPHSCAASVTASTSSGTSQP